MRAKRCQKGKSLSCFGQGAVDIHMQSYTGGDVAYVDAMMMMMLLCDKYDDMFLSKVKQNKKTHSVSMLP